MGQQPVAMGSQERRRYVVAKPGMVGETGQGFGWLRLEAWGQQPAAMGSQRRRYVVAQPGMVGETGQDLGWLIAGMKKSASSDISPTNNEQHNTLSKSHRHGPKKNASG